MFLRTSLLTSTLLLLLAANASAGFMFEFGQAGSSPESTFEFGVGDSLDVQVYLREMSGGTVLATEGLFSSGVKVTFDETIAAVSDASDIVANPGFDDITKSVSVGQADLYAAAFLNPLLTPDASNRILVGTFTFSGVSAGTTTISVADLDPALDDTVTGDYPFTSALDPDITSSTATITVKSQTVVPEPASCLIWGLIFGVGLRRRRSA